MYEYNQCSCKWHHIHITSAHCFDTYRTSFNVSVSKKAMKMNARLVLSFVDDAVLSASNITVTNDNPATHVTSRILES